MLALVVGCVCWTLIYFLLMLIAIIGNYGIGSPIAYPAGIFLIATPCVLIGWGIFTPAAAIGRIFTWFLRLPRIAAIPVVFISAFTLSHLVCWAWIELATTQAMPSSWVILKKFSLFLSIPLGIYWWLTEGPGAIYDAVRRWIRNRRIKIEPSTQPLQPNLIAKSSSDHF